jgi:hypothetical protein
MKYEFKNLQTGQPCCRGDNIKHLCNACVQQAIAAHERAGRAAPSAPAPTVAAARPAAVPFTPSQQAQFDAAMAVMNANAAASAVPTIEAVPEVPSLTAAIAARRGGQITYNLDAPVFGGGGVRTYPVIVAAAHETIDDPPSLTDAIRRTR